MSILKSLALGNTAENFCINTFRSFSIEAEKNSDTKTREFWDLDCVIGKKKFKVEVKYDVMAQKTGNLAIEFYNSKSLKPSGIDATKAHIWAHVIQDDTNKTMWIASVKQMKLFIKDNTPFKTLNDVGDNNACIHLYKDSDMLSVVLHRFETLDETDAAKLVRRLLK